MSKTPTFSLNQKVIIPATGQLGEVMAFSQSVHDADRYRVDYVNGQGNLAEEWFYGTQLQPAPEPVAA